MKKAGLFIFCIFFSLSLAACSNPSGVPDELYQNGVEILETADSFLDGDINSSTAFRIADRLSDEIHEADVGDDISASSKKTSLWLECSDVAFQLELIEIDNIFYYGEADDADASGYADLLAARNALAEVLGKPARAA